MKKGDKISVDPKRPWLSTEGKMLTDDELKKVSSHWNAKTWDRYLDATVSRSLREDLALKKPHLVDQGLTQEDHDKFICDQLSSRNFSSLTPVLKQYMQTRLTQRELHVVRLYFWENQSQREIALKLNVSRASVRTFINRAIRKIEKKFTSILNQ